MVGAKHLTIIARMDDSGLGHQTRNLVRALNPDRVIVIDFSFYNGFKQHPEWYKDYNTKLIDGFIKDHQVDDIIKNTDIILTAETYYNQRFIDVASEYNKLTLNQINYEFFEPLSNRRLLIPSLILMPSYWHLNDMKNMTGNGRVEYLPPPTFVGDYDDVRQENRKRTGKKRFLHVAGKIAAHDRAGTQDLINSLKHSKGEYELVIKVQSGEKLFTNDERVTLDYSFPEDERELYRGFDAMIQPRRYAGLNLPMNEALSAGLPVIMTDISPNNQVLSPYWLVQSFQNGDFFARTRIELYSVFAQSLAGRIDEFAGLEDSRLLAYKDEAHAIAVREYSVEKFQERWAGLAPRLGV